MRHVLVASLLVAAIAAGCVTPTSTTTTPPATKTPAELLGVPEENIDQNGSFVPHVVVGILDTGPVPYHEEFRQVAQPAIAYTHPSEYLTGFPAATPALNITLDLQGKKGPVDEVSEYLEADKAIWSGTKANTLYWIPGTRFVGQIAFGTSLPGGGHGSMTASRAGGNTISLNDGRVLLVEAVAPLAIGVAFGDTPEAQATRWMADQPFIDIQSHSWGWPAMCAGVATSPLFGWAEAFKYAREKQLVLVATANGHGNTGTLGYPSQCQDNAGVAGVLSVGATDNAAYPTWANWFPAVSADGCGNPAIDESSISKIANTGSGTSSATPTTAGSAAAILLEARKIFLDPRVGVRDGVMASAQPGAVLPKTGPLSDGKFTIDEMKDVLIHTASYPVIAEDIDGDDCNQSLPVNDLTAEGAFPFIGYGEVGRASTALALKVIRGEAALLERPNEDLLYENDQAARRAIWG